MRSARNTLKRLAIDVSMLKGRWLVLAADCAVRSEAPARAPASTGAPAVIIAQPLAFQEPESSDERIIILRAPAVTAHFPLRVFKD